MTCRMGLHIQNPEYGGVWDYVRQCKPGLVKFVEKCPTTAQIREAVGWGALVDVRLWTPDGVAWPNIMYDPEGYAERHFTALRERFSSIWPWVTYVESENEYVGHDKFATQDATGKRWVADLICRFERRFAELCNAEGKQSVGGNMGRGNPELDEWALIVEVCQEKYGRNEPWDVLGVHEYWCKSTGPLDRWAGNDRERPYFIGRWEHFRPLPKTVMGTEGGYENDPQPPKWGWQGPAPYGYQFAGRDAVYAQHFADYCNLMVQLADKQRVTFIGMTFFTVGRDAAWIAEGNGKAFDFTGIAEIAQKMATWPKEHTVYEAPTPPPTPPTPPGSAEWWGRFADIARERPEVGQPTGKIVYDAYGNAIQFGVNGYMVYDKQGDRGYYIPAVYVRTGQAETENCPNPF